MPTYKVEVIKTKGYTIEVEAENRTDAENIAILEEGRIVHDETISCEFPRVEVLVKGAEAALERYREVGGPGDDIETAVQDLITDLLHLYKAKGEGTRSPHEIIGRAVDHFIKEI